MKGLHPVCQAVRLHPVERLHPIFQALRLNRAERLHPIERLHPRFSSPSKVAPYFSSPREPLQRTFLAGQKMPKAKSSQAGHKKRIPLVEPLQRTFCRTATDFAAIHGLSSVGKDPRQIREISITDWTNVFSCPMPGLGQKIRHDEAKQEYHEDLILLHWKVYQELPKNGELGIYFAKGFAIERLKVAPEQINWAHFAEEAMNWLQKLIYFAKGFAIERLKVAPEQINWAHFAEEAMNWLQKHNQLEGKMDRWQLKRTGL